MTAAAGTHLGPGHQETDTHGYVMANGQSFKTYIPEREPKPRPLRVVDFRTDPETQVTGSGGFQNRNRNPDCWQWWISEQILKPRRLAVVDFRTETKTQITGSGGFQNRYCNPDNWQWWISRQKPNPDDWQWCIPQQ